jgi:hypothetical protein
MANQAATERAIQIGTGWDSGIHFADTTAVITTGGTLTLEGLTVDAGALSGATTLAMTGAITGATGLTLGSATTDGASDFTIIMGAQTDDPQFVIAMSDDANGDVTMTTTNGDDADITITSTDDIMLDPGGDVINFVSTTETMTLTNGSNLWTFNSAGDTFVFSDAVDVDAAFTASSLGSDAGLTLQNADTITNAVDDTFLFSRDDTGIVTITAADDDANAALTVVAGGTGKLTLGNATNTDISIVTDGLDLSETELALLDGETDLATQSELDAVAALVDTDDEIIAIINASPGTYIDIAAGGTGVGTFTDGGILTGNGTTDIQAMAVLTDGQILVGDGTTEPTVVIPAAEEFIPIGWMDIVDGGSDPPESLYSTDSNSREVKIATFDGATDEALTFLWRVPENASGTTLKFKWSGIVTNATGPSSEAISFSLDCVSVEDGAQLDFASFGATATAATESSVTEDQDDIIISAYSAAHTPTSMAAGEVMLCELIRDADGADTYAQDFGLFGVTLKYAIDLANVTF